MLAEIDHLKVKELFYLNKYKQERLYHDQVMSKTFLLRLKH